MLFKLSGAALIISASSKIGFDYALSLKKRVEQLHDLKLGILALSAEISFRKTPLYEALSKSADSMHSQAKTILKLAGKFLSENNGTTAKEAIIKSIEQVKDELSLKTEDYSILKSFAALLGTSDLDNQTINIQNTQKKLDIIIKKAEEERDKHTKLYSLGGVMAGLLITVLFL